ncbi:MAG: hypothetical protein L0216_13960 [Planctomycetales bacterium]|nr:hypothetical protein [Planctomycetales bacterium]
MQLVAVTVLIQVRGQTREEIRRLRELVANLDEWSDRYHRLAAHLSLRSTDESIPVEKVRAELGL